MIAYAVASIPVISRRQGRFIQKKVTMPFAENGGKYSESL